jgi:hypothetical protein
MTIVYLSNLGEAFDAPRFAPLIPAGNKAPLATTRRWEAF